MHGKKEWPASSSALFKFLQAGPGKAATRHSYICFSILIYLLYTYPVMSEGLLCAK